MLQRWGNAPLFEWELFRDETLHLALLSPTSEPNKALSQTMYQVYTYHVSPVVKSTSLLVITTGTREVGAELGIYEADLWASFYELKPQVREHLGT